MTHEHLWQLSSPVLPLKNGGSCRCFQCQCGATKIETLRISEGVAKLQEGQRFFVNFPLFFGSTSFLMYN